MWDQRARANGQGISLPTSRARGPQFAAGAVRARILPIRARVTGPAYRQLASYLILLLMVRH